MTNPKHPLVNIAEWRKGCSCAENPSECAACTTALVNAIEAWFQPLSVTYEQAQVMFGVRMNRHRSGISEHKGGSAWLDGEFSLSDLEALCVIIRHECGGEAKGAVELQAMLDKHAKDDAVQGGGCRGVDHYWLTHRCLTGEPGDKTICANCGIEQIDLP